MTNAIRVVIRAAAVAVMLWGQFAASAAAKPSDADQVLDRWVKAIGGKSRLQAVKDVEFTMRQHLPNGMAVQVSGQIFAGGLFRLAMAWPTGEQVTAYDGEAAWIEHPLGRGVFARDRAEEMRRSGDPHFPLKVPEMYPHRRRLPDETRDGKVMQVLELRTTAGQTEKWFFNATTHLLIRIEKVGGDDDLVTEFSDFRKIDGVIEPFRTSARGTLNAWDAEILTVRRNVKLDRAILAPPEGLVEDARRVEALLDRYIQVSGGLEAESKLTTRVTRTAVDVVTAGVNFISVLSQREPDRVLIEQEVPGMGRVLQGFDGQKGWAWAELQGYREMHGSELAQIAGMAPLRNLGKIRAQFPLHKYLGETVIEGRRLVAVEFSSVFASGGVHYFDPESGHIVRIESLLAAGPNGMMKVVMELSDFRAVDGIVMPFVNIVTNPAMRIVNRVEDVKHNVELPDRLFLPRKDGELPPEG